MGGLLALRPTLGVVQPGAGWLRRGARLLGGAASPLFLLSLFYGQATDAIANQAELARRCGAPEGCRGGSRRSFVRRSSRAGATPPTRATPPTSSARPSWCRRSPASGGSSGADAV